MKKTIACTLALLFLTLPALGWAWHDETHIAIAKAAGFHKWFNAAGADIAKIKAGAVEKLNHYVNNSPGTTVCAQMVLEQANLYNNPLDFKGHLYGAIIGALRAYKSTTLKGKYAEYHLAFCAHYVGDLSQPLHNTLYNQYNEAYHSTTDGIINEEVLQNLHLIKIYPIKVLSEEDLAREIARIANLSMRLGYQLEQEARMLSRQEAYEQISHSVSLLKGILRWVEK